MGEAEPKAEIWTVTDLTRRIKSLLERDVGSIWVAGEISNFRVSPAGHSYFTLKDDNAQIDAVMFKGKLNALRFEPENGLEVVAFGLISVYERRGNYQIVCEELQPKGLGALQLAFEKLKAKLAEEGLFDEDRKRPLPLLPRRIGVVTSPTGAAIRDILNVINRRFAQVHILLYPARVQGDEAAREIVAGIRALDRWGVDVMIVGRGGGSLEDLWPFNEEPVVRAVAEANTPIISAVGHEIDFTLCDFAADMRAPTPSAAAELVVQEQEALAHRINQLRKQMAGALVYRMESLRNRLQRAQSCFLFKRPEELLRERRQNADDLRLRLEAAALDQIADTRRRIERAAHAVMLLSPLNQVQRAKERRITLLQRLVHNAVAVMERRRARLNARIGQLDALSPLAILSRGYALARKMPDGELIRDAAQLEESDRIHIRFGTGGAVAAVEKIIPRET